MEGIAGVKVGRWKDRRCVEVKVEEEEEEGIDEP